MPIDPRKARRAAYEDVRKLLSSPPATAWDVEGDRFDGVSFTLTSSFELGPIDRVFHGSVHREGFDTTGRVVRRAKVWAAGGFVRTDTLSDDTRSASVRGLEHPKLGTVYVDVADKTYLHFSPNQLEGSGVADAIKKVRPEWTVAASQDGLTLSARGPLSLDLELAFGERASESNARAALAVCLPGFEQLIAIGLPLAELVSRGLPKTVRAWHVDRHGKRIGKLATHELTRVKIGPIAAETFRIPADVQDRRQRPAPAPDAPWHTLTRRKLRPARHRRRDGAKGQARAAAMFGQGAMMEWVPPTLVGRPMQPALEPVLPSCLPSTFLAACATQIRQGLLDTIGYFFNLVGERLTSVSGVRANDDTTDVTLNVDWLEQLRVFSEGEPLRAGLFCLLRDAPTDEDPVAGRGLLDQFAASLARDLLAADEPLPFGGDDPVTLPQEIVDAITLVINDEDIRPEDRFDELSLEVQVALREQVLAQRLATIALDFDGDFGEHLWPNANFALLHVRLQLESLAIEFPDLSMMPELTITADDANRPQVAVALAMNSVDATVHMDRWPGGWFWVIAPIALVAGGIATAAAVGVVIATLMGLGPLGLIVLFAMLQAAPIAAIASVFGGLLLVAAVTYLVWDVTDLRLQVTNARLRTSLSLNPASDPEEVAFDPGTVTLEGEIAVSVQSAIPSGIHQLFDWIVNNAITNFDREVRDTLEDLLAGGLETALRRLPHFRLPLPRRIRVDVPVPGGAAPGVGAAPLTARFNSPRHRLLGMAATGVADTMLDVATQTVMEFPFPSLRPYLTQVDQDSREKLSELIERLIADKSRPLLGYAVSQNLLNAVVFSRWLAGRYAVDYDEDQTAAAFDVLKAACADCKAIVEKREVHVWAAATPQVLVTPRAFLEDERRPYLQVWLPDVRLCMGGVAGKPSLLEIQFSITAIAHVAFGAASPAGEGRTLFTLDAAFLHVLFDNRGDFRRVSPVETQGVETRGPGLDAIATMDEPTRLAFLQAIQPLLATAASRLLGRESANHLVFEPESLSVARQIYDSMFSVDFHPRRASVYATIAVFGPAQLVMPFRDDSGQVVGTFDLMTCEDARNLLEEFE